MKRIALICAHPKHNPGMLSVDLSFDFLIKQIKDSFEVTKFTVKEDLTLSGEEFSLNYKLLSDLSQLDQFDFIFIWGDFLLWKNYGLNEFLSRKKIKDQTINDNITEKWYSLIMMENRQDLQKKTIIFGTTLYGLNSEQLSDERYRNALVSSCDNSKLMMFRDIFSVNFVSQLSNNKNLYYGLDCALFLELISKDIDKQNYICYSFGRSGLNEEFLEFSKTVANKSELELVDISWLDKSGLDGLSKKIDLIKNSSLLITDIYHCSITGIREKTPVIALGRGASTVKTTLDDKKKEIFLTQIFLSQNYIYAEDVLSSKNNLDSLADYAINTANDLISYNIAQDLLSKQKEFCIRKVTEVLLN